MATITIPWGDGSGDNIYLTYSSASGNQTVEVTSDANTGDARTKVVTFTSGVGSVTQSLTVNQEAGQLNPIFHNYLVFDGAAEIDTGYILPELCSIAIPAGSEKQRIAQNVFYATGGGGTIGMEYNNTTTTTSRKINFYYDSATAIKTSVNHRFSYTRANFFMTPKRQGAGNSASTYTKGSVHPTGNLIIGGGFGSLNYTGAFGIIHIYDSSAQNEKTYTALTAYTPIATFRPCTYGGEAGLWYVEADIFLGNSAGSGTLTVSD